MVTIHWVNGQAGGTPLSAENLNLMQQYIENYIDGQISIVSAKADKHILTAYNTENQNVSNNTTVNLAGQTKTGTKLTLQNNKIIIGANVSKIKVSASVFFQDYTIIGGQYLYPRVLKNSTRIGLSIQTKGDGNEAGFCTVSFAPFIVDVEAGDEISLNTGDLNGEPAVVRGSQTAKCTYLTVEVVEEV